MVPAALTFDTQPVAVRQVVVHDGRLYAVGDSRADTGIVASAWRSDDGLSWTLDYHHDVPSSASVVLSTDDHVYVGGFNGREPILWTETDGQWKSTLLPSQGALISIAEMRDGIAALTIPVQAPASAFSHDSYVHMTRDSVAWTTVSVFDFTDGADRLGNQLLRWRNRLLLLSQSQASEIWSTKW